MFTVNAAFVMTLLAIAFRRVPQREQFSSAIVVYSLGLMAVAAQPSVETFLRGNALGRLEMFGLGWCAILWFFCVLRSHEDWKNPPDRRAKTKS